MNVEDLKPEAQLKMLRRITEALSITSEKYTVDDDYQVSELLVALVNFLDDFDQDDNFGTEGWRHSFGVE